MTRPFRAPLLWLSLVLFLGSSYFGTQQSQPLILPVLKLVAPHATAAQLNSVHALLRKLGHLGEYAVLALLWLRGFLATRRVSLRTAAWAALLVCVACAFVDEAHQSMLPSRTGSALDVDRITIGSHTGAGTSPSRTVTVVLPTSTQPAARSVRSIVTGFLSISMSSRAPAPGAATGRTNTL